MRQSRLRHTPIAVALGGACLLGIGVAGCSRDAGLDLAKQEASTDRVITERANEAILRSKQELASAGGKPTTKGLATTDAELDERPTLASRWKAPFKSAGNLLRRKPDDVETSDPFLASKSETEAAEAKQALAKASGGVASDRPEADSKSAATEKRIAQAGQALQGGAAANPSTAPKSRVSAESQAALESFLKSQEPLGVSERALAANHEPEAIIRKPGTPARTASTDRTVEMSAAATVALDDSAEGVSRTGVKAGRARPFPGAEIAQSGDEFPTESSRTISVTRAPAGGASARNPLAAAPAGVRRHPLLEDAEEPEDTAVPSRTKQATGREIAALLKKARTAGELGELDEARSYATAASELAEQCSYEFAARELSPEKIVAWLDRKEVATPDATPKPQAERRQIVATRRSTAEVAAQKTGFSRPSAEQVFAEEVESTVAAVKEPASRDSAFQEWAAGVGRTPATEAPGPNWPVLSSRELAASDELWQPSRSEFQQQWTDLRSGGGANESRRSAETRLASGESDAPAFVATVEAELSSPVVASVRPRDPIVLLGEPTDLAPGSEQVRSGTRRGPRLATPPPLSIEDAGDQRMSVPSKKGSKHARTLWFATIGGLALLVLVAFRRWAYRTTSSGVGV